MHRCARRRGHGLGHEAGREVIEQVMAYYWVTQSALYLQSLGFGRWLPPVDMQAPRVRINQYGADNSFTTNHPVLEVRLGKDDAEDGEVILHELGARDPLLAGFRIRECEQADAISEGFGDYWAVTVGDVVRQADKVTTQEPLACVADWDSTSYTTGVPHCLRRLDDNLHYPGDLNGEVHHDGQIWSQALLDIRSALHNIEADTIIVEGSMNFLGTTMPQLARRRRPMRRRRSTATRQQAPCSRPSTPAGSSRDERRAPTARRYAHVMSEKQDKTGTWLRVPFDWRRPTVARVRECWWNPDDRRLFTPKTFGWGFDINLYEAARRLRLR